MAQFKKQHTALIPTLTLWTTVVDDQALIERLEASAVEQVRAFTANGGPILFGTDVGFMKHYDITDELAFMGRALSPSQVLASLTTAPAAYFKAAKKGRVAAGFDADLVVADGPISDVRNLAKVVYTVRAGRVIYQR